MTNSEVAKKETGQDSKRKVSKYITHSGLYGVINNDQINEGKANSNRLLAAQGGSLTLTNRRLVFVGHAVNLGEGTISINLGNMLIVRKAFAFSIFAPIPVPNAIKIVAWLAELEMALNQ